MKAILALTVIVTLSACGRVDEASKKSYQKDLEGTWSTSCTERDDGTSERQSLTLTDEGSFTFVTRSFNDETCDAESQKVAYEGDYSIGGFVLRKGMSGRTVTMNFGGETHRAIFVVGGDRKDELTEYDLDGEVLHRYHTD